MLGRSKRVLFSAFKMARMSGDLTNMMWMHGIPGNAVTNHFSAHFFPWHRKYHLGPPPAHTPPSPHFR